MQKAILIKNLNTSYVDIKRLAQETKPDNYSYLNTSYVDIKHTTSLA